MAELAFITLGSNIQPETNLPAAVSSLRELGRLMAISNVYQNPAIGGAPQPDFLNAAVLLQVELEPTEIRARLRDIESQLGRVRTADKYAPRTIDLDLAILGARAVSSGELTLPDPELTERAHLAVPLAELAPDFPHPLTGEPLRVIAERLRPQSMLRLREGISRRIADLTWTDASGPGSE